MQPVSIFDLDIAPLFYELTLPARFTVDGFQGGDVVFRDITTGEFVDLIENPADRALASVHSFRGTLLPTGAAREEWWRALPGGVVRLFKESSKRFNESSMDDTVRAVFERESAVFHRMTIPAKVLGTEADGVVEMRELTFGRIDDLMSTAAASRGGATPAFALASAALGREVSDWLRKLPARVGTLILGLYSEIHSASKEEEDGFFGAAVTRRDPPKVI